MDLEHEDAEARAELLAEELTDAELHELLRRLGQAEFGGSERATVAAVVEATGRGLVEIGRILGDIRREAYDQRFGSQLRSYERRLERLEDVAERMEDRRATPANFLPRPENVNVFGDSSRVLASYRAAKIRATARETQNIICDELDREHETKSSSLLFFVMAAVLTAILLFGTISSQHRSTSDQRRPQPRATTWSGQ